MEKKKQITTYCSRFKLGGIKEGFDEIIEQAQTNQVSYLEYTLQLFSAEAIHREQKDKQRRMKAARLPQNHRLDTYDYTYENGINKTRLSQLRELDWLDKLFNIVFMGPSGTGKTYLAAGLCADAVYNGYKAYFRTMEEITNTLKMKDITRTATTEYKRLLKADLIAIDDIMMFPVEKDIAVKLFNFINTMFEKTSFIITTNKAPGEWAEMLDDKVLVTAILDRLLYRCEVINLSGKSYRMKNRKKIFNE
ncbi:MAG: IS21-like element helper ATPase IstB [Bacteroidales bacterium]